jgi:hypothetical protein
LQVLPRPGGGSIPQPFACSVLLRLIRPLLDNTSLKDKFRLRREK